MLLHIDGFDTYASTYDLTQTYYLVNNPYLSTSGGRFGKGCVQFNNSGQTFRWSNNTALTNIWLGFAYTPWVTPAAGAIVTFMSASGVEASLYVNANTSTWTFLRGDNNAYLGSATVAIPVNMYHWIDIHYSISNSVGVFELWVDNARYINLSNINNTQYNNSSFSIISFGATIVNSTNPAYGVYDDLYILDTTGPYNNTRLGDSRIETLAPISDTGSNNGTPSTGTTHYNLVNALPWAAGSTSITIAETAGQEELFNMKSLSVTPTAIAAVKVKAITSQTSGGSMYANTIVVSNGIENDGNATLLSTSFGSVSNIFPTDPNTSNTWTSSSVNSMSCGFKVFE